MELNFCNIHRNISEWERSMIRVLIKFSKSNITRFVLVNVCDKSCLDDDAYNWDSIGSGLVGSGETVDVTVIYITLIVFAQFLIPFVLSFKSN